MDWKLYILSRLLQQTLIIKVLEERFLVRIVGVNYLFELLSIFGKFLPWLHSCFELLFDRSSLVIVLLVFHNTICAEKFLLTIFACFNIAYIELFIASLAIAQNIVVCCPFVKNRSSISLICHWWFFLVTLNIMSIIV